VKPADYINQSASGNQMGKYIALIPIGFLLSSSNFLIANYEFAHQPELFQHTKQGKKEAFISMYSEGASTMHKRSPTAPNISRKDQ
jgi:hypothetical protein